ncbi:hypothetical protein [Duncaniella freteri]|uniref:hypothetical protein n=4 Tax=Muribaculaceae TaxID=2005473 RepID=UPI002577F14B|nr:hypothetical protein [Duncaniella freteri]
MTSCSSEDEPDQPDDPTVIQDYHFDLWVALDRHGGMGRDVQTLVRSVNSLEAGQPEITFQGTGTEVNSILSLETILKGAYYYQVPVSGDRFAKYIIKDNKVEVVKERRFQTNTYATRKYTHAWINDNTLVIMAATGDATKIVWTKLNADDMTIISEGTLDVPMPEGGELFTTSGILNYRASDNKLFYFYFAKQSGRRGKRVTPMMTAVINPATMAVESNTPCFLDCEMVGTAYGELLQTTTFIDGNNNLYIACVTDDADGKEYSHLLKIPANSTSFDQSYDGFTAGGKLISVMYVGDNKVVAYARDDAAGTDIDSFSHYYTVIDVVSKTSTPITYNGQRLAYSSGRFSSRMAYVNHKAYVGVDTEGQKPQIYIYDVEKNQTALGATMASGYYFEQIRVVEDAK